MNEEKVKAIKAANTVSEKKVKMDDPKDWGDDSVKTPGMIPLSQLEAMLSGVRKPSAEEEYVEKYLNIRHNWKPAVQNKTPIVDKETTF